LASEQVDTSTRKAFADLETFAERSRRADEQTAIIAGMPAQMARSVIYLVGSAVVITLAILFFGRVQTIVETTGTLMPHGNVHSVQAGQGGVVLEVLAAPGDRLPAGAVLMRIDASDTGLALAQARNDRAVDEEQLRVLRASLERINRVLASPGRSGAEAIGVAVSASTYTVLKNLEPARIQLDAAEEAQRLLPEKRKQLEREAELTTARIALLDRTHAANKKALAGEETALVRKQEERDAVRRLAEAKLLSAVELNSAEERYRASEMALLQFRERVDQLEVDGSTARLKLTELQTSLRTLDNEARTAVRNARVQYDQALASLVQERENAQIQARALESKIAQASRQVTVSEGRLNQATVTMPVAGTIAEFKIKNAGEIVAAGAPIATVVPADAQLYVEAKVSNRDIGFLRPGIEARIKIDAFPFQQFGTARARVSKVLPAVGSNASFDVELEMLDQKLSINGADYHLFPGLAVHAELITGRRRMLEVLMQRQDRGGDAVPAPAPASK
jgi:multidrug resistance efflux pump